MKQKQEHKMILEEILNIIWFLCSKNTPDSGTEAQETRHLNGEEERTNTGNLI